MGELPRWFSDTASRKIRNATVRRQEAARAAEVHGSVQTNSGSHWASPGDIRTTSGYLEELKRSDGQGSWLRKSMWQAWILLRKRAIQEGRSPRLVIDLVGPGGGKVRITMEEA